MSRATIQALSTLLVQTVEKLNCIIEQAERESELNIPFHPAHHSSFLEAPAQVIEDDTFFFSNDETTFSEAEADSSVIIIDEDETSMQENSNSTVLSFASLEFNSMPNDTTVHWASSSTLPSLSFQLSSSQSPSETTYSTNSYYVPAEPLRLPTVPVEINRFTNAPCSFVSLPRFAPWEVITID